VITELKNLRPCSKINLIFSSW